MIVGLAILLFIVIAGFVTRHLDHKQYNDGTCNGCGNKIKSFDVDSQSGTGWVCRQCGHSFWTSWVKTS